MSQSVAAAVPHTCPGSYWPLPSAPSLFPPLLQVDAVEGVLIYRFQAPLHFANVAVFKSRIQLASGVQLVKRRPSPRESDGFLPRLFRGVSQHCSAVIVAVSVLRGCDQGSEQPCCSYFGMVSIFLHDSCAWNCYVYFVFNLFPLIYIQHHGLSSVGYFLSNQLMTHMVEKFKTELMQSYQILKNRIRDPL